METIELHQRPSAASLHEALDRQGALPAEIKPLDPAWCLHGRARTVKVPDGDNTWLHRAVRLAAPGEVLVVSADGSLRHGYWGELLTRAAMRRGLAGLVIDGGVRDGRALTRIGWPVFARGLCIRGTTKTPDGPGGLDGGIRIGGVRVRSGDLVVGDADGVVVAPEESAAEALRRALRRERLEDELLARLQSGAEDLDLLNLPVGKENG